MKRTAVFLSLVLLAACAGGPTRVTPALDPGLQAQAKEASDFLAHEDYLSFKKAFRIYAELGARPGSGASVAADYLRASILLGVREKDLGLIDPVPLDTADRLIAANPKLASEKPLVDLARLITHWSRGVMGDVDPQVSSYWDRHADLDRLVKAVTEKARTSVLAAYILAEFHAQMPDSKLELGPDELARLYPSTLLLPFVKATRGEEDALVLGNILSRDPGCAEAYFFLGNTALRQGLLLRAEHDYEKAREAIPESPQISISLASVAFAEEEFERAIDFYDKTLDLSPDYREAMLGKAICLTYLGRNAEAMALLNKLLGLGYYLLGESHFWLAWNLNDLGRLEEAQTHIEQAKKLLGQGQVFTLSGLIAQGLGQDDRAKADFLQALNFNSSDAEALLNLGGIFGRQHLWDKSGTYARNAGAVFEAEAGQVKAKAAEIQASSLPDDRKAKLLRRKSAQLDKTLLSAAQAYYNAAAAFLNAGDEDSARPCLAKAAAHPALKDKAEELAARIKRPS